MFVKSLLVSIVSLLTFSAFSQQLNKMLLENWTNGSWENKMQQRSIYDEQGRLEITEIAHWNATLQVWEDQTKTIFSRDESGHLLKRETLKWMPDQVIWTESHRVSYVLNEFKKPSEALGESFEGNKWTNQSREQSKYDNSGRLVEKQTERWDKVASSWIFDKKYIYATEKEQVTGYTIYFWDTKVAEWHPYKKAEYIYDGNTLDHILYDSWLDGSWKAQTIRRNLRDNRGGLNATEVDQFDLETETWLNYSHVDFTLTDFGKIAQTTNKKWNLETSIWENQQRSTYTYSDDGVMIEEWIDEQKQVELFPNPATEKFTIRSLPVGKITVFDALGKIVFQAENENHEMQLDVTNWEIGTYTIDVNGSQVEKFVKQ